MWNTTFNSPFTTFYESLKNDLSWVVHTVRSGHDVMIDAPNEVIKFLEEAAL